MLSVFYTCFVALCLMLGDNLWKVRIGRGTGIETYQFYWLEVFFGEAVVGAGVFDGYYG